jgi:predicted TPR repeat methyltransferase
MDLSTDTLLHLLTTLGGLAGLYVGLLREIGRLRIQIERLSNQIDYLGLRLQDHERYCHPKSNRRTSTTSGTKAVS